MLHVPAVVELYNTFLEPSELPYLQITHGMIQSMFPARIPDNRSESYQIALGGKQPLCRANLCKLLSHLCYYVCGGKQLLTKQQAINVDRMEALCNAVWPVSAWVEVAPHKKCYVHSVYSVCECIRAYINNADIDYVNYIIRLFAVPLSEALPLLEHWLKCYNQHGVAVAVMDCLDRIRVELEKPDVVSQPPSGMTPKVTAVLDSITGIVWYAGAGLSVRTLLMSVDYLCCYPEEDRADPCFWETLYTHVICNIVRFIQIHYGRKTWEEIEHYKSRRDTANMWGFRALVEKLIERHPVACKMMVEYVNIQISLGEAVCYNGPVFPWQTTCAMHVIPLDGITILVKQLKWSTACMGHYKMEITCGMATNNLTYPNIMTDTFMHALLQANEWYGRKFSDDCTVRIKPAISWCLSNLLTGAVCNPYNSSTKTVALQPVRMVRKETDGVETFTTLGVLHNGVLRVATDSHESHILLSFIAAMNHPTTLLTVVSNNLPNEQISMRQSSIQHDLGLYHVPNA